MNWCYDDYVSSSSDASSTVVGCASRLRLTSQLYVRAMLAWKHGRYRC
jgi:hypothetical protein